MKTTEELLERITLDPDVCHGQPCIRGMRIMAHQVLDLLAAGISPEEIIAQVWSAGPTCRSALSPC